MKTSLLTIAAVLIIAAPSFALAQSDCHGNMKDMLEGTLDMAEQAEVQNADVKESDECTLARGRGTPLPQALARSRPVVAPLARSLRS